MTRRCPVCGVGLLGRYDEECISCAAKRWLGLTRKPLSHLTLVLDPDGRDVIAADEKEKP